MKAKKYNIRTLAPDVNSSFAHFTASPEGIRFGMAGVRNVGEKAVEQIVGERTKGGAFKSLLNFAGRLRFKARQSASR